MGHIGPDALKTLPEKTIYSKSAIRESKECETYVKAKAMAKISRILIPRAKDILEKVYSNIYGLISLETFSKNRYFVSLIDNKTRYTSIRLLRTRD